MMELIQDIKTKRFWRYFLVSSFACLGAIGTILQTINVISPKITIFQGSYILIIVGFFSTIVGLIISWPKPISQDYNSPKTRITIVEGDILKQPTHIVIGTNDTFDTETPVIIDCNSLQGQALHVLYGDNRNELDAHLDAALVGKSITGPLIKQGSNRNTALGLLRR